MTTPAEQIAAFVAAHPGEWRPAPAPYIAAGIQAAAMLPIGSGSEVALVASEGEHVTVWALRSGGHHVGHVGAHASLDAPLLARVASRVADCLQLRGGDIETLPAWLIDPVRRELRRRAGDLLTLAGFSPGDVVSAAETLDEALCKRPPVPLDASAIVNALMSHGMSCRWVRGEALILIGDFVYLREDLDSVPVDDFAAFTEKHGAGRIIGGDKSKAPKVPGYRPFMALAPAKAA